MPNYYNGAPGRQPGPANEWNNYQGLQQPNNMNFGPTYGQNSYAPPQTAMPMQPFQQIFVQGEAGARAYQLPPGCNFGILWDAESSTFYIKRIDQNGRPMPLEIYDYAAHVDPPAPQVDLSQYVTTAQLKQELEEIVGKLSVGSQGRIVLNESGV